MTGPEAVACLPRALKVRESLPQVMVSPDSLLLVLHTMVIELHEGVATLEGMGEEVTK